jgi:hypothetical protein
MMADMTGKKGIVIYSSIEQCMGKEEAEEFARNCPLSKSADYIRNSNGHKMYASIWKTVTNLIRS